MAAPYHADATDIPSGALYITSHTPNTHNDGTSSYVLSLVVRGSNQRSYSKFDGTKRRVVTSNQHPEWCYSVLRVSYSEPSR
eukprot:scaffold689834_cov90-Attheya_sp.AAC.1